MITRLNPLAILGGLLCAALGACLVSPLVAFLWVACRRLMAAGAIVALLFVAAGCERDDPPSRDEIDLATVAWDGADVRGWEITHDLTASIGGSTVRLSQTATRDWPDVGKRASKDGRTLIGNAWVIARVNGVWRAATWEWMVQGQQSKGRSALSHEKIQSRAWAGWSAQSGDTVYLMLSGLCRDNTRNIAARTPAVKVRVP
jgi:hypothetical protein